MLRGVVTAAAMLAAGSAMAGEITGEEARALVAGKLFDYTCFEGTKGAGRVFADGSVVGTIQFQGDGPVRRAFLPAGTLKVENGVVCASLRGLPIQPCFNLDQVDARHFRGSIRGLGFAYCDFTQHGGHVNVAERARHHAKPLELRPSLASDVTR
jgi:hypothetical protein